MNENRLRALLRETPVPGEEDAQRRGLRVLEEAFAERTPPRQPVLPRLAIALAAGALIAALALSPAGAEVRDWIGDVFETGVRDAEPALTRLPGGGRLLVQSSNGPWVVQPDGSRRLLGDYKEASWSPRGLFVAATAGHTLNAVEPDGTVRWSLSHDTPVSDPRWSPSGFRIAYRAGHSLRVVAGDGTGDTLLDPRVAAPEAAWLPGGPHLLAYVDGRHDLRVVNTDSGEALASAPALRDVALLAWSPDGSMLLEASRRSVLLHEATARKLGGRLELGSTRQAPLPAGATVRAAVFSPGGEAITVLLGLDGQDRRPPRSEVVLIGVGDRSQRRLFSAPGHLTDLAPSPNGQRLLISWREANQWLFIPVGGRGGVEAVDGISGEFSPGTERPSFPQVHVDGWCCPGN